MDHIFLFLLLIVELETEWWGSPKWDRFCSSACICKSRGAIPFSTLLSLSPFSFSCSGFTFCDIVLYFILCLVWLDGTGPTWDSTACNWTMVYREKRSYINALHTPAGSLLSYYIFAFFLVLFFASPHITLFLDWTGSCSGPGAWTWSYSWHSGTLRRSD